MVAGLHVEAATVGSFGPSISVALAGFAGLLGERGFGSLWVSSGPLMPTSSVGTELGCWVKEGWHWLVIILQDTLLEQIPRDRDRDFQ
jgi:hypothetical protein